MFKYINKMLNSIIIFYHNNKNVKKFLFKYIYIFVFMYNFV